VVLHLVLRIGDRACAMSVSSYAASRARAACLLANRGATQ